MTKKIGLLFLIAWVVVWFTPRPVQAQEENNGLSIQVRAGFDGYSKRENVMPVHITLANSGPAVEGYVRLVRGDNWSHREAISLPTQSNKRVTLYTLVESPSLLRVELINEEGTILASQTLGTVRSLTANALLYGVVTNNPDSFDELEKATVGGRPVGVAILSWADLPTELVGWSSLDVLILNDVDSNELTATQQGVLRQWVNLGGQLVVTGGSNWQKTTSVFTDWLPVTPTGSESVSDLPALAEQFGEFRDSGPYVVTTSSLRAGALLLRQENLPLLAHRPQGMGRVYFLALDPNFAPLLDWDGAVKMWRLIGERSRVIPVWGYIPADSYSATQAASIIPSLQLPSIWFFSLFICTYVLLIGPGNYLVLNRLGRRELAWVSIPGLIVVFTVLAYLVGFQIKGNRPIVTQMSLVEGQIGGVGRVNSITGIYSPRRSAYSILIQEGYGKPLSEFSSLSDEWHSLETDNSFTAEDLLIDIGGIKAISAVGMQDSNPFEGSVTLEEKENNTLVLNSTITNNGDKPLENAILLLGNKAFSLGTIDPGQTKEHTATLRGMEANKVRDAVDGIYEYIPATDTSRYTPLGDHYSMLLGPSYSSYSYSTTQEEQVVYQRRQLLDSLGNSYNSSDYYMPDNVVTLIGWVSDTAQLDIEVVDSSIEQYATTLYFLQLPFTD